MSNKLPRTFGVQWVLGSVGLRNVDDTMDVERHLFAVRAPVLVAEAVEISTVVSGGEGVVTVRDLFLERLVLALGIRDLRQWPF
jgi:hypothetical protein